MSAGFPPRNLLGASPLPRQRLGTSQELNYVRLVLPAYVVFANLSLFKTRTPPHFVGSCRRGCLSSKTAKLVGFSHPSHVLWYPSCFASESLLRRTSHSLVFLAFIDAPPHGRVNSSCPASGIFMSFPLVFGPSPVFF